MDGFGTHVGRREPGRGRLGRWGRRTTLALALLASTALVPAPGPVPGATGPDAGAGVAPSSPAPGATSDLAGGAPAADADLRLHATSDGARAERPARGVTEVFRRAAGTGAPVGLAEVLAAAAERSGARVLGAGLDEHEEPDDPGDEGVRGTLSLPLDVGDLDGDGTDDVLVSGEDLATGTSSLEAVRGHDGASLWQVDGDGFALLAPDLDGDGAEDVVLHRLVDPVESFDDACDDEGCRFSYRLEADLVVSELDGRTGAVRWSDSRPLVVEFDDSFSSTTTGTRGSSRLALSGLALVLPVGDLDGDGVGDLLLDELDRLEDSFTYESTGVRTVVAGVEREVVTTSFDAAGRQRRFDGGLPGTVYDAYDGAAGAYFPLAGDLDGDGTTELVLNRFRTTAGTSDDCVVARSPLAEVPVCREPSDTSADDGPGYEEDLVAVDGDGRVLWQRPAAPVFHFVGEAGDLDGGGGRDLVVDVLDLTDLTFRSVGLDGAGGGELWRTDEDVFVVPAGDLEADGDDDLLLVRFVDGPDEAGLEVARADGATAAPTGVVTRHTRPVDAAEDHGVFAFVAAPVEVDGTPGADVVVGVEVFDDEGSDGAVTAERGHDGVVVATFDTGDTLLLGLTDLDGDGVVDVVTAPWAGTEEVCEGDPGTGQYCRRRPVEPVVALTASTLPAGDVLWRLADVDLETSFLGTLGDLDGRGGDELALYRDRFEVTDTSVRLDVGFTVLRGTDAAGLWSRGPTS